MCEHLYINIKSNKEEKTTKVKQESESVNMTGVAHLLMGSQE